MKAAAFVAFIRVWLEAFAYSWQMWLPIITGLAIVTEAMSPEDVPLIAEYADILQVGTRSMENYALLEALGRCGRPVLLKRGMTARLEDLLRSAQVIALHGNPDIILCERGIRTFETYTRNTLDISAIPIVKKLSHLPIVADPSHGTGRRDKVPPMGRAAKGPVRPLLGDVFRRNGAILPILKIKVPGTDGRPRR